MCELKSIRTRTAPTATAFDQSNLTSLRELKRTKLIAGGVLVASLAVLVVAKLLERYNSSFGFLLPSRRRRRSAASPIGTLSSSCSGGPLGLPIPHTAIIPANHRRIAERLGEFIGTHFLAPEPVGAKLRQVDFAAAASDWLRDPERSDGLAHFILRVLPEADNGGRGFSGLRSFLARQLVDQIEAVELAPLAAELMTTFTEDHHHQRLLDEVLITLNRLMTNPVALDAISQKIRGELPTLLNLYRADRFLLKKIAYQPSRFSRGASGRGPSTAPRVRSVRCDIHRENRELA